MTIHLNLADLKADALLNALASFCRIHGAPRCYQNWSPETLRDYLAFHAANKTLVWLQEPIGAERKLSALVATGVAWQCFETEIRARHRAGIHMFDWKPTDQDGDSVFFADFVCTRPGALAMILEIFADSHPEWRSSKWFTYRKGRLIRLTRRHIAVVLRKVKT